MHCAKECNSKLNFNNQTVKTLTAGRIRLARALAVCVDLVQLGLPYIFGEGFLSPINDVLDVLACVALILMIGWHYAFIPTFLIELVPIGDLAPTWTIAVFIATRGKPPQTSQTRVIAPPLLENQTGLEITNGEKRP